MSRDEQLSVFIKTGLGFLTGYALGMAVLLLAHG